MANNGNNDAYKKATRDMEMEHYYTLANGLHSSWECISDLDDNIRSLRVLLQVCKDIPEGVQSALDNLSGISESLHRTNLECGNQKPEIWKPSAKSVRLAQRVFGITELCEQILGCLKDVKDISAAMRMNRATMATARASNIILRSLGRTVNMEDHWRTPFSSDEYGPYGHFYCSLRDPARDETPKLFTIRAGFCRPGHRNRAVLPRIGTAFLATPICKPLLYEMQPVLSCCDPEFQTHRTPLFGGWGLDTSSMPGFVKPIVNQQGITVGDLYGATVKLMEEHSLCPFAEPEDLNTAGFVLPCVHFTTTCALSEDDPVHAARREVATLQKQQSGTWGQEDMRRQAASKAERAILEDYTEAKKNAFASQSKIPTLEEYLADKTRVDAEAADEADRIAKLPVEMGGWRLDWDASNGSGW
ncbi:hypothetical protein LTR17_018596 [Elasticomyces elasticus]|nr:hypothetical protein LTR17_018596 [Elasticomyces elasticus]